MVRRNEVEFIGHLYDAALGRIPWESVVAEMAEVIGSQTSSLIAHDPIRDRTEILGMHCLTDDYVQVYGESFFEHDLWTQEALRRQHYDRATLGVELVSDHAWERSVIYNEFLRPRTDAFHLVGGMVHLRDGGVLAIGCHRPRSGAAFTADHQATLARLMPHLQRAVEVYRRLLDASSLAEGTRLSLQSFTDAVIYLNHEGAIVELNLAAEALLNAGDGLVRANGRLRAAGHVENSCLQALISQAAQTTAAKTSNAGSGGHLRISRPSGRRAYATAVSPLGLDRAALSRRFPAVLVIISDPASPPSIDVQALRELYGLSQAEAQVAAHLSTGRTLRQIAGRMDVTINTVRTLLARAMAKTETHSQVGLVRLVLTGPAGTHWRRR